MVEEGWGMVVMGVGNIEGGAKRIRHSCMISRLIASDTPSEHFMKSVFILVSIFPMAPTTEVQARIDSVQKPIIGIT